MGEAGDMKFGLSYNTAVAGTDPANLKAIARHADDLAAGGEAALGQRRADATPSPADPRTGALARQRPARAHQLLRRARQSQGAARLPLLRHRALVPGAATSQPARPVDVGTDAAPARPMATVAADRPS